MSYKKTPKFTIFMLFTFGIFHIRPYNLFDEMKSEFRSSSEKQQVTQNVTPKPPSTVVSQNLMDKSVFKSPASVQSRENITEKR